MQENDPENPSPFEQTSVNPSRWDREGTEYVKQNAEWVGRCARRMTELRSELGLSAAQDLAQELSLDDNLRALAPEGVAERLVIDLHLRRGLD
jgi:hypothetical protein